MNYSVLTDIGRMRSQNQDAVFATEETIGSLPNLFVVADGMGGHKAGEYASSQAIALAKREIASDTGILNRFRLSIRELQQQTRAYTRKRHRMRTNMAWVRPWL